MKISFIGLMTILGIWILGMPGVVSGTHTISGISPTSGLPGQTISAVITGTGFTIGDCGTAGPPGITINICSVATVTQINFNFSIASAASAGPRTFGITTSGDTQNVNFTVGAAAAAVGPGAVPRERIPTNITSASAFIDLLDNIVDWIFVIVLVGAVIFIVLAGWQFISGGGEPQALSQAKSKLLWAAVGIAVAVLARGLIAAVRSIIGS